MMRMTRKTPLCTCLFPKVMLALFVVEVGLVLTMKVSLVLVDREVGVGQKDLNVVVDVGVDEEGVREREGVVASLGGGVEVEAEAEVEVEVGVVL